MSAFLTLALVHLLGVASPGPDFAFITKQSLTTSRKTAWMGAVGLGLAVMLHCAYCILGIGMMISKSILLFNTIKYLGAAYLIYIGWKAIRQKGSSLQEEISSRRQEEVPMKEAIMLGFLCNALNPKATVFFLAVFTQVVDPQTSFATLVFYSIYMGVATMVWFSFLASVFTLAPIRKVFAKAHTAVERTMGAVLIALGCKVALAANE